MVSVSWVVVETHLIIGCPRAVSAALALEFSEVLPDGVDKTNAGSRVICLELQHHTLVFDDDDNGDGSNVKALQRPGLLHLLVDSRFDLGGGDGLLGGMNMLDLHFFSRYLVNTFVRTELPARTTFDYRSTYYPLCTTTATHHQMLSLLAAQSLQVGGRPCLQTPRTRSFLPRRKPRTIVVKNLSTMLGKSAYEPSWPATAGGREQ